MTPFEHAKRGSMSPQRRARIFAAHDGKCHICTRKIGPADYWEVEHVTALERGGTDDDSNLAPVCEWCHKPKTADDHAEAGRMRRSYTRHVVPRDTEIEIEVPDAQESVATVRVQSGDRQ